MNLVRGLLAMVACAWIGANLSLGLAAATAFSPDGLAISGDRAHAGRLFGLIFAAWSGHGGAPIAVACVALALLLAFLAGRQARPIAAAGWVLGALAAISCQLWYAGLVGDLNLIQDRIAHDAAAAADFRAMHREVHVAVAGECLSALLLALGALAGIARGGAAPAKGADAH